GGGGAVGGVHGAGGGAGPVRRDVGGDEAWLSTAGGAGVIRRPGRRLHGAGGQPITAAGAAGPAGPVAAHPGVAGAGRRAGGRGRPAVPGEGERRGGLRREEPVAAGGGGGGPRGPGRGGGAHWGPSTAP